MQVWQISVFIGSGPRQSLKDNGSSLELDSKDTQWLRSSSGSEDILQVVLELSS